MLKIIDIARFEIVYHLRKPSTWMYFVSIIGLTFLILTEIVDYSRTIGGVLMNAPITIAEITGYTNLFGLLLVAAIVALGGMRDLQSGMAPLMFSSSVTKYEYLSGRLLGLYAVSSILIISVLPCALLLAHVLLDIESDLYGPYRLVAFTGALLYFTLPNVFISTALAFACTIYFRNFLGAYLGILIFFICFVFGSSLVGQWNYAGIIDPSGRVILDTFRMTLPTTIINSETVDFSFLLFANRFLWIIVSFLMLLLATLKFNFSEYSPRPWFKRRKFTNNESSEVNIRVLDKSCQIERDFDYNTRAYQFKFLSLQLWKGIVFSRTGWVFLVGCLIFFFLISELIEGPYDIPGIPTTEVLISILKHPVVKSVMVFSIIIFSGQLIWKERDYEFNDIVNTAPISNATFLFSKFFAIGLLIASLQCLLVIACILFQIFSGFDILDLTDYGLFFITDFISYCIFAAAIFFIHAISNQKILANFLGIIFYLYTLRPELLNIEYKLWIYGAHTGLSNSVFHSQTSFLGPWVMYTVYWSGWAFLLLWISIQIWNRGSEMNLKDRLCKVFINQRPSKIIFFPVMISIITGAVIFFNTNVVNEFHSLDEITEQKVLYAKLYGKHKNSPQPHLIGTNLDIELFPDYRRAEIKGKYVLQNSTSQNIESIHVTTMPGVETSNITFNRSGTFSLNDRKLGYMIFKLNEPMTIGSQIEMDFNINFEREGFLNSGLETSIMDNGTHIDNVKWFPVIGYQGSHALQENPSPFDISKLNSRKGQETIYFEAKIGTSLDQIAVAPGKLIQRWKEDDRNYFHYRSSPILNQYKIYSANYQVTNSLWNDIPIEIYHHPENDHNLERMERAAKATLSYGSDNFGSYPFSHLKFVEYPDPGTGAFAFPGVIEYSSKFVLNKSKKENLDVVFAASAHEVGHQWWGHKILPAPVEGSAFLIESLAWYTAFGAIEATYGKDHLNRLLSAMRKEYLNPRSKAGTSLLLTNSWFQAYRKGPLAMYALRTYVGEDNINRALNQLITKFESGEPPYATSYDLYKELKVVTPDSLQYLLKDLLEENMYWTLSTTSAKSNKIKENRWRVTLEVFTNKISADKEGVETEKSVADLIEIGVFGANATSEPIYLKKHKLVSGYNSITVEVCEKPIYAGIDPRNLLLDPQINDNIKQVFLN